MKVVRRIAIASAAVLIAIQLVPVTRSNPPVETEIAAPERVQHILSRSCYDCHSNKTVWPWYSRVAPVSWLVSNDVSGARHKMNFTTWNQYTPREQAARMSEIWKEVDSDDMPPGIICSSIKTRACPRMTNPLFATGPGPPTNSVPAEPPAKPDRAVPSRFERARSLPR